jgi:hypothetical protein
MRVIAIIIAILGLATFVYGILFVAQAGTAEKEVANEITPLTLDQVDAQYNTVSTNYEKYMAAEEPKIQAKQAEASATYNYLSSQRALLGLAKSNIGTAKFVRTSGTVDIILGLGMFLAGVWLLRKSQSAA